MNEVFFSFVLTIPAHFVGKDMDTWKRELLLSVVFLIKENGLRIVPGSITHVRWLLASKRNNENQWKAIRTNSNQRTKKNRQIEKVFRNRACHNNILEIFITFNWKIWRRFFFDTAATAKTAKRGESEKWTKIKAKAQWMQRTRARIHFVVKWV